jgi:hypothetical protein
MKLAHEEEITQASEERKNGKHSHVAVKVWSEPMQAHICVVADEEDAEVFRTNGLKDTIYTADEIQALNCLDKDSLKALHTILFDD